MTDVLGHNSALQGSTGPETTWANEIIVCYHSSSEAGSIESTEKGTTRCSFSIHYLYEHEYGL